MRSFLISAVFALLFATNANAQPAPASADEILKEAYDLAAKENKNVIIIFHASWCGWCHRMDTSMNDKSCKKFFDDYYVVRHLVVDESKDKQNLENPGANELRTKYHGDGIGIPFWLLFDKNGKLLSDSKIRTKGAGPETGDNIGCPASEKEVAYFVNILKQTSGLSADQLEIIRKRFRENDK